MIELSIKKFIQFNEDWKELLTHSPYNLTIRYDNGMFLLKYSQYESDMSKKICQEARGIIFDEENLEPVCIPYFKFFNYGEEQAAEIDWSTAQVQEKVDGSLMKMFFFHGWRLATNGTIDAFAAVVGDSDLTFGDLFVEALGGKEHYDELCKALNPNYCYMFELVHPASQVVLSYGEPAVYFHGMRNMITYEEEQPYKVSLPYCRMPKYYGINNLAKTVELVGELNDGNHEGVVVCDAHFNRIKMKTEEYLRQAKIVNNGVLTAKTFARMYLANVLDDYSAVASEGNLVRMRDYLDLMDKAVWQLNHYAEWFDIECKDMTRKEKVLHIKSKGDINGIPMFAYYMNYLDKKNKDAQDFIYHMSVSKLVEMLKNMERHYGQ